ncbi:MAG: 50S ribosomal protein L29 [Oscillospiraceae bacterium]|nr:50S ribosomal protein L29 [Oscillospiraceae bacterium]
MRISVVKKDIARILSIMSES